MRHTWAKEEVDFLKDNYQSMSNEELARELGIKQKSVENKLHNLGLKRKKIKKRHIWSKEEEQFLRDNYQSMSNSELASKLGVKKKSVANKLSHLGLKRADKNKSYRVGGGILGNLRGILFGVVGEKFVEEKYPYIFVMRYYQKERNTTMFGNPRLPRTDVGKIGFACDDIEEFFKLVKNIFFSGIAEEIRDGFLFLHKPKYEFSGNFTNKELKELKKIKQAKTGEVIIDNKNLEEEMLSKELSDETKMILQYAKKFREIDKSYEKYCIPDYVVFSKDGVHIYEFKASASLKLNHRQKKYFQKIKDCELDTKVFVVRPGGDFPPQIEIKVREY